MEVVENLNIRPFVRATPKEVQWVKERLKKFFTSRKKCVYQWQQTNGITNLEEGEFPEVEGGKVFRVWKDGKHYRIRFTERYERYFIFRQEYDNETYVSVYQIF